MNILQGKDEFLGNFFTHFNKECLLVENHTDQLVIDAFINGLNPGQFYSKLGQWAPTRMSHLIVLVKNFAKAEEANCKKQDGDCHTHKIDKKDKGKNSYFKGKSGIFDCINFNKNRPEPQISNQHLTHLTKTRTAILSIL